MINEKPTCGKRRFACPNSHCVTNDRENLLQFNYHTRAPDAWRNATNCAFSLSQLLTFHKKTFKKMSLKLILHDISFTPPRRTSRLPPPPPIHRLTTPSYKGTGVNSIEKLRLLFHPSPDQRFNDIVRKQKCFEAGTIRWAMYECGLACLPPSHSCFHQAD